MSIHSETYAYRLFEKSNLIPALAIRNRAPLATSRGTRPTQWLGYTRLYPPTWVEDLDFVLVRTRRQCQCSSELYSPKTFQTSSKNIENPADIADWIDTSHIGTKNPVPKIRNTCKLVDKPLLRENLKQDSVSFIPQIIYLFIFSL